MDPPHSDAAELEALLARVPGWAGRARVTGVLEGGITNRNVVVDVDGEPAVLRLSGKDTHLLCIDRATERVAAERAAGLGFAPEVLAFLEPEGYLVTRFVPGRALGPEEVSRPDVLREVADMLRSFHATAPLPHPFDAFRVPHQHREAATARGVAVPAAFHRAAEVATEIEAAFGSAPDVRCPCHNDLLPANLLRGPDGRLWLLDWEYAGTNDRYFDLGNLAVNNELEPDAEDVLLAAYFGSVTPRRRARLRLMKVMSDFREAMWGVVQQGISTLEFDYATYAERHLDRLLTNATAPDVRRALTDAVCPEGDPRA